MLNLNAFVRHSAAITLRRTPNIRGRGRVASLVNSTFPAVGSEAICSAQMRLGYKMRVDLRAATECTSYYTGDYDTVAIKSVLRLLPASAVVLDVGANIGYWTVPLAQAVTPAGTVHAFEPVSNNFKRLSENIAENGLGSAVVLHPFGLSDQNTILKISLREDFANGSETGNAAVIVDSEDLKFESAEIQVHRLDDVSDSLNLRRIDLIKVDIEGHEDRFLAGAANVIRRFRPLLYLEINEPFYRRRGLDPDEIFGSWLELNSYQAAFQSCNRWALGTIQKRIPSVDNVLLLPCNRANEIISSLTSKANVHGLSNNPATS